LDSLLVVPFNDLNAAEEVISTHKHRLAAMIVEPILNAGGLVSASDGYLRGLRRLADKYGILLIFDEIVTFRLSRGGWQEVEGIEPDITALGKIIGGGFGVGAIAGRAEIMELFNPTRPDSLRHSGTFNGQSVVMAAGIANLEHLQQPDIDRINRLGERMHQGLAEAFRTNGLKGYISGWGSLAYMHWTGDEVITAADAARAAKAAGKLVSLLQLGLLNRGIWVPYRGELSISTPMTEREITHVVAAVNDTLQQLRPYAEETAPHVILS
jgi:glutamate-1-semialdehyde 2,1-aminomutase